MSHVLAGHTQGSANKATVRPRCFSTSDDVCNTVLYLNENPLIKGNARFKQQVNLRCGPLALQRQQHIVPLFLGRERQVLQDSVNWRIALSDEETASNTTGLFPSPNEATGTQ